MARRYNLWKRDPRCHWCEKETKYSASQRDPLLATLDHIYPRGHPLRNSFKPGQERTILACRKCNAERGNSFVKMEEEKKISFISYLAHLYNKRERRMAKRPIWRNPIYMAFDFCVD